GEKERFRESIVPASGAEEEFQWKWFHLYLQTRGTLNWEQWCNHQTPTHVIEAMQKAIEGKLAEACQQSPGPGHYKQWRQSQALFSLNKPIMRAINELSRKYPSLPDTNIRDLIEVEYPKMSGKDR